ncbi:hypothetical protein VaNZ11_003906 [Volvox africanus]|uniref:Integrase catalytic domain-containing protein n=1 Tax=Volvox africanus TaxID=51714 RepID=A0ABQ5RV70_9CHLO|nr:hypothetical protein VaNZ11_003906 [Volvox africanus]
MAKDTDNYVLSCDLCQRNKSQPGKPHGHLQPMPIPDAPWEGVSMDFIVVLPKTEGGYDALVVLVNRFTKMIPLAPTTSSCTAEQTARLFFDNVVRLHGVPKSMVSDCGTQFHLYFFWSTIVRSIG